MSDTESRLLESADYNAGYALMDAAKEIDALRAELEAARGEIAHKDDAIASYSEFYERAASLAGLPQDCNPCAEADEIILHKIADHDEIAVLKARIAEFESYIAKLGIVAWVKVTAPQDDTEPPQVTK